LTTVGAIPWDTLTVPDDNLVDASEIENGKLIVPRGMWAYRADRVATQLHDEAEHTKKFGAEVLTVPSLTGSCQHGL
jgi:hypothetical protein